MSKDNKVSFIIDSNGNKTHAIIPIDAYQELLNLQTILKSSFDLNEKENYYFSVKGVNASGFPVGKRSNPSFMINKGSMISVGCAKSLRQQVIDIRNLLIEKGTMSYDIKLNCYILNESYMTTSPSFAASLVAGNNRSGLDVWTNKDGYSLKDSGYGPHAGGGGQSDKTDATDDENRDFST